MSAARDYEHVGVDEAAENESVDGSESRFTQSLKSSILQGVEENGRRYHRFCKFSVPNTLSDSLIGTRVLRVQWTFRSPRMKLNKKGLNFNISSS